MILMILLSHAELPRGKRTQPPPPTPTHTQAHPRTHTQIPKAHLTTHACTRWAKHAQTCSGRKRESGATRHVVELGLHIGGEVGVDVSRKVVHEEGALQQPLRCALQLPPRFLHILPLLPPPRTSPHCPKKPQCHSRCKEPQQKPNLYSCLHQRCFSEFSHLYLWRSSKPFTIVFPAFYEICYTCTYMYMRLRLRMHIYF